jgi:hypothetical protein
VLDAKNETSSVLDCEVFTGKNHVLMEVLESGFRNYIRTAVRYRGILLIIPDLIRTRQ